MTAHTHVASHAAWIAAQLNRKLDVGSGEAGVHQRRSKPIACAAAPTGNPGGRKRSRPACRNARKEITQMPQTDSAAQPQPPRQPAAPGSAAPKPQAQRTPPPGPAGVRCAADLDIGRAEAAGDLKDPQLDRVSKGDRVQEAVDRRRQGSRRADGRAAQPSAACPATRGSAWSRIPTRRWTRPSAPRCRS